MQTLKANVTIHKLLPISKFTISKFTISKFTISLSNNTVKALELLRFICTPEGQCYDGIPESSYGDNLAELRKLLGDLAGKLLDLDVWAEKIRKLIEKILKALKRVRNPKARQLLYMLLSVLMGLLTLLYTLYACHYVIMIVKGYYNLLGYTLSLKGLRDRYKTAKTVSEKVNLFVQLQICKVKIRWTQYRINLSIRNSNGGENDDSNSII